MVRFRQRMVMTVFLTVAFGAALWLLYGGRNDPWASDWSGTDTFYTSYVAELKTLDPAVSYYAHEGAILDNIVEAPLGYDYLKRPYKLVPVLASSLPEPAYYGASGERLPGDAAAEDVVRAEYEVVLKQGVLYQPHPCFAVGVNGVNRNLVGEVSLPADGSVNGFAHVSSREMVSEDFKVGLTRLCDRRLASPVFSNLSSFILGMDECSDAIAAEVSRLEALPENAGRDFGLHPVVVDYRKIPLRGFEIIDRHRFKLVLSRKYPQLTYWLTMHFFSPVPYEALRFYGNVSVSDAGYHLRTWPVGTGAFMMTENRPMERVVLERNPLYRDVRYPGEGTAEDASSGLLEDAGKRLPFLERVVFNYEREPLPVWMKFQQGYYDDSGIPADMFNTAVDVDAGGDLGVSGELSERGVRMVKSVQATTYYIAFNMLDEVVGGLTPEAKALRHAISIALDFHEYVEIFSNGRDVAAQSLIPPNAGIAGACELNPYTDVRDAATGKIRRRSIEDARKLMSEAGYPGGVGADGKPLTLYFDDSSSSSQWKARYQWMKNKLSQLGIVLESRVSDSNRHRDKISRGDWQMIMKGWVADYPDAENFLFLFYSKNGTVINDGHGMNYSNYASASYDEVFKRLESMTDGPERLALIEQAVRQLQEDAPYVWAFHRRDLFLLHTWYGNYKPQTMGQSTLQYRKIDGRKRLVCQRLWNVPVRWPFVAVFSVLYVIGLILTWRRTAKV